MDEGDFESMASMASEALHRRYIDNGTRDEYLLPEEVFDSMLSALRRVILYSNEPLKERVLDLYVYCIGESDKVPADNFYGSSEWVNVSTAVRNFLRYLTAFDLDAWEKRELAGG